MRILIVGAGIAGLALSRLLRQRGISAQLVERRPGWPNEGAGIGLPSNSVRAFDRLGLSAELHRRAHRVTHLKYAKASGETLAEASLVHAPFDEFPCVALLRHDLIALLAEGIEDVRFGTALSNLQLRESGVDVEFSSGERQTYDLVVAADGIHSSVRRAAFPEASVRELGATCFRFVVEQNTDGLQPSYYFGKDDVFMLYPVSRSLVYCYAHLADERGKVAALSPRSTLEITVRKVPLSGDPSARQPQA